jgi:CubicO group peptidase (beta-lactamase class C family)
VTDVVDAPTAAHLQARLEREQSERRLPSVVAGLVRDGELKWWGAAGGLDGDRPDLETQYRIGSITKTFVAVALLRLRDEGLLDLDDPVEAHVAGAPAGRATLAQVLAHSSGLQAETDGPWWERTPGGDWPTLLATLGPVAAQRPPGRRFHYSNVGFALLGEVVARRRAASWAEVVRAELLVPLGMTRTSTRPAQPYAPGLAVHPWADVVLPEPEHDHGAMGAAGQLWSTIKDLARWAAFLGGRTGGLLAPATLTEMCEPLAVDDRPGLAWTGAHGLGLQVWNLEGRRYVGHGGSMPGFLAGLRVEQGSSDGGGGGGHGGDGGDGVVLCTNTTAGLGPQIIADLLAILADRCPRRPTPWVPSPVAPATLDLTGTWFWGPAPFVLRALPGGGLELAPAAGPGRASRFVPVGPGRWRGLDAYYTGEQLVAVRLRDGSLSHLDLASFVLTRAPYSPGAVVPGGVDPLGWRPR